MCLIAASTSSAPEIATSSLHVFKGEGYEHWSHRMKTFFRSQNLWKIIKVGVDKDGSEDKKMENEKDDAKALFLIQQAVDEIIFHRIVRFNSAKEAWDHIKNENQGTSKMIRQQTLRQKFDLL